MLMRFLKTVAGRPKETAQTLNDRGMKLANCGDFSEAELLFRRAIHIDAGYAAAYGNLGQVLFQTARFDEALAVLRHGVEIDDKHAGLRNNLATVFHRGGQLGPAIAHYRAAIELDPTLDEPRANLLKAALDVCDWNSSQALAAEIMEAIKTKPRDQWARRVSPVCALQLPFDAVTHRKIAEYYSQIAARNSAPMRPPAAANKPSRRLRIGYLSCDFRNHAVTHQLLGVLRNHDRDRFEVLCYSYGPDDKSLERCEVQAQCEHFLDIAGLPDAIAAQRIADAHLDVLFDLAGHTGEARPAICAARPAPIQVNYLGYPGTLGADYIDYIIADDTVIPRADENHYSEHVLRLPNSFFPTDNTQPVDLPPSRESQGLPRNGVVFCCFNQPGKIDRQIFEAWIDILRALPQSVLWLRPGNVWAKENLRRAAAKAGLDPARLCFAGKMPLRSAHLARYGASDLFLDTHTYNAHATASDALWGGLPVLTWSSDTFASRVGASLLRATGLQQLIVSSRESYIRRAIELGENESQLAALRQQLAHHRQAGPLFSNSEYTRQLESLLLTITRTARSSR